jgi:CRISPR-associated endonuclease/helicase Cas3
MKFYAHSNEFDKTEWQFLADHLVNTATIAKKIGADSGVSEFAYITGFLHDIGKYSLAFQKKLSGSRIKVDHSTAGAQAVRNLFDTLPSQRIISMLMAYCIAGHHVGLPDYGNDIDVDSDSTLAGRLKKKIDEFHNFDGEIDLRQFLLPKYIPIKPITKEAGFSLAFFTRMIYSTLVDADFIETETFIKQRILPRGENTDLNSLASRFSIHISKYKDPESELNKMRCKTLFECIAQADQKPGLFTLTIPTGGGKTIASMAFALNHAVKYGMKRIIYVIPYTSIIDQSATVFKEIFPPEMVLEHHSNFDWKAVKEIDLEYADAQTNNVLEKLKLATENWDIPIVLTTNVQFFESLYANRSSACRKIHNISKSVVIFDEAQMLPKDFLKPCMFAVAELVRNYGVTAVLCTATQPPLSKFMPGGTQISELVNETEELYQFYKRVGIEDCGVLSDDELASRINGNKQALCIVNTRKHAKQLFELLEPEGAFHLSTLMTPKDRKRNLASIKERLSKGLICRVVSTQLMEAGVDLDFPVGFRSIAGMDSIIQAAGRVNREGKAAGRVNREGKVARGTLFVFEPDSQILKRTPAYIKQNIEVTRNIMKKYGKDEMISPKAIRDYYELLYDLQDKSAADPHQIIACFEKGTPGRVEFDFKKAADKFKIINDCSIPVIVPNDDEGLSLIEELKISIEPGNFSRKLQKYTVNIYEQEFDALQARGVINVYSERYNVLIDPDYYNPSTGLVIPDSVGGDAIIF